jgi:hypothetical protein
MKFICNYCGKVLYTNTSSYLDCFNCNTKYLIKDNHYELFNKNTQKAINEARNMEKWEDIK